jgi:aldehyde dehydrogenase (NAD(P)+)
VTSDAVAVDRALAELVEGAQTWAATPLSRRRQLLEQVRKLAVEHASEWICAAAGIKGLPADSPLLGEEWLSGPYAVALNTAALANSLAKLEAGDSPLQGVEFGSAPGGRTAVEVFPLDAFDRLLLSGFSAQVWLQPGVGREQALREAGLAQRDPSHSNGVGAVLGAGNIFSIAPLDTLYELFAHNRVVALKLNPVTDPLLGVWTKVLQPFISLGVVRILTGGAETGQYLVSHSLVDHVHMTGSALTHDAIVYGTGAEGARRKAADEPILDKPVTSELGGVSPTVVLPGQWSKADIRFQAQHVATQRLHNNGYNCIAAQVVVLNSRWAQREEFIDAVRAAVDAAPARQAYYPGSNDRVAAARASYPQAQHLGQGGGRVLVVNPPDRTALLQTEYFGPVLGIIELDCAEEDFAAEASRVVNEEFIGTLGINVLAAPSTIKAMGAGFDEFIAGLHYGTVAVNAWTGVGYLTATATWGAFPGHTRNDVQSGIGVVHNALLIDNTERTVVRGPFRPAPRSVAGGEMSISPKPPWFVNNRTGSTTGRLLVAFAGNRSWLKIPAIVASALRG